jgi:hypothetical protein
VDLSNWHGVDKFSFEEVVNLAAGIDPEETETSCDLNQHRPLVARLLSIAYFNATRRAENFLVSWCNGEGSSSDVTQLLADQDSIFSIELLGEVKNCMKLGKELPERYRTGLPAPTITFDRTTLSEWFKNKGYESSYTWDVKSDGIVADTINKRLETSYLNVIGALLECKLGNTPNSKVVAQPLLENEADLKKLIVENYQGVPGLSPRNLDTIFAKAKNSLGQHKHRN